MPVSSPLELMISFALGIFGLAYLTYGFRQRMIMATVSGIAMSILPWVTTNPVVGAVSLVAFVLLPWFVRV